MKIFLCKIIGVFIIFSLVVGGYFNYSTFASNDLSIANELRAIAALIEKQIVVADDLNTIKLDTTVSLEDTLEMILRFEGLYNEESDNILEYNYGVAVANGILKEDEVNDWKAPTSRASFMQMIIRIGGDPTENKALFLDINENITYGEAAYLLYNELVSRSVENMNKNVYIPLDYDTNYFWSVQEFQRFMSGEYRFEHEKFVRNYDYQDGEWKIEGKSLDLLLDDYSKSEVEYIKGKTFNLLRNLLWKVRENDDYIVLKYDENAGVISIEIYPDENILSDENPAIQLDIVPKGKGKQSVIEDASFELYLAHLYDEGDKVETGLMTKGEFGKFIKVAKYMDDDFAGYLDQICLELFNGREESIVRRIKNSYYDVKSDPELELTILSKISERIFSEWHFRENDEKIYGFKARIFDSLK